MTKYTVRICYLIDGVGARHFTYTVHAMTRDAAIDFAKQLAFEDGGKRDGRLSVDWVE